jgi:hypothetical protein
VMAKHRTIQQAQPVLREIFRLQPPPRPTDHMLWGKESEQPVIDLWLDHHNSRQRGNLSHATFAGGHTHLRFSLRAIVSTSSSPRTRCAGRTTHFAC